MKVKVEQRHIDHGVVGSCKECPVALALTEATSTIVIVGQSTWRFCYDMPQDSRRLPDKVIVFISDFDDDQEVEPIEFEVKL